VDASEQSLRGVGLLDGLPDDALRSIEKSCNWRIYPRDEQILDRDSDSRDVYFVVTGEVQVVNYSMTGREIAFAKVRQGGYFGELAAIDGKPRSANVVAAQKILIASLPRSRFEPLLLEHPRLAMRVIERLAHIVRLCDNRIMDLSTLRAVQRVQQETLRLAELGKAQTGELAIATLPTHKDIAARASTSRETVARVLKQLDDAGIIERTGKSLRILEPDALRQLIEDSDLE
jgi:CRP/FNR family transcriptional regulator, cyclic AMP receptor protein